MLEQLRHFLAIAQHGSLTEAARVVGLSQPALTSSLRRLEDALGTKLFARGRRGAALTPAGEVFLLHAKDTLASLERGRIALADLDGLHAGEVRIAAGATVCTYVLPASIAAFRAKHPGLRWIVRESSAEVALSLLARNDVDLVIISDARGELLMYDELILVAGPRVADPDHAPFVTMMPGTSSRALTDAHFPGRAIAMELGAVGAVLAHVEMGGGVGLISKLAAVRGLARGTLVEVPDPRTPLRRPLRLVCRDRALLPPAAARFRRFLLEQKKKGVLGAPRSTG